MIRGLRLFFLFFALVSGSALAVDCLSLLHANLRRVSFPFEKAGNPSDTFETRVFLYTAPDSDGFYFSSAHVLGYIDFKTGRLNRLLDTNGAGSFFPVDPGGDHLMGMIREGSPQNKKPRKGPISPAPETSTFFFLNKKTRKIIYSSEIPRDAIHDGFRPNATFYPYAVKDVLNLIDVDTGKIRTLALPFVPTEIKMVAEANAVLILAPRRRPMVLDITTGMPIPIPSLSDVRMPSGKSSGLSYQVLPTGKRILFRTAADFEKKVTHRLPEFDLDLETRTVRKIRRGRENDLHNGLYADGRLETYLDQDANQINKSPKETIEAYQARMQKVADTQILLYDTKTGRPLFPATSSFEITTGKTKSLIQTSYSPNKGTSRGVYLFDHETGALDYIDVLDHNSFIERVAYDSKTDRWLLSTRTFGVRGEERFELRIYSNSGKKIDTAPLDEGYFGVDRNNRFIGFISNTDAREKGVSFLDHSTKNARPKAPTSGWKEASKRLSVLMPPDEANLHYPELLHFFATKRFKDYPESTAGIFLNLFTVSNLYANKILRDSPELLSILRKNPVSIEGLSAREFTVQSQAAQNLLRILTSGAGTSFVQLDVLQALRPFLERTPKRKVEDIVDSIAEGMKNELMRENEDLAEVFESKLYKFVRHSFSNSFGLKEGPITDLTVTQSNGELKLLALGSSPIENGTRTRFGLSYRELGTYPVDPEIKKNKIIAKTEVAWTHEGQRFTAKVLAKTSGRTMEDIVKFTDAPEYQKLLKNKKLTTAIVTGTNLQDDAADVLHEYLQAFKDRGYHFDKDVHVPDLYAFLKEKFETGEIDLFVKEAHSDGDEKNLFRIFRKSELKVGRKRLPNGEEEVVYLVFPSAGATSAEDDATTRLISNAEFGEWIRVREKLDIPLIYLNSSCWSSTKAMAEIQAAASPALVEIPSLTSMDTFVHEKNSTMYETVFGILDRRTYDQIQEAGLKDPATNGGNENILVFPSTSEKEKYTTEVLGDFTQPIDVDVKVFDSKDRPYHIDQQE